MYKLCVDIINNFKIASDLKAVQKRNRELKREYWNGEKTEGITAVTQDTRIWWNYRFASQSCKAEN